MEKRHKIRQKYFIVATQGCCLGCLLRAASEAHLAGHPSYNITWISWTI